MDSRGFYKFCDENQRSFTTLQTDVTFVILGGRLVLDQESRVRFNPLERQPGGFPPSRRPAEAE